MGLAITINFISGFTEKKKINCSVGKFLGSGWTVAVDFCKSFGAVSLENRAESV